MSPAQPRRLPARWNSYRPGSRDARPYDRPDRSADHHDRRPGIYDSPHRYTPLPRVYRDDDRDFRLNGRKSDSVYGRRPDGRDYRADEKEHQANDRRHSPAETGRGHSLHGHRGSNEHDYCSATRRSFPPQHRMSSERPQLDIDIHSPSIARQTAQFTPTSRQSTPHSNWTEPADMSHLIPHSPASPPLVPLSPALSPGPSPHSPPALSSGPSFVLLNQFPDSPDLPQLWSEAMGDLMYRTLRAYDVVVEYQLRCPEGKRWSTESISQIRDAGVMLKYDASILKGWQLIIAADQPEQSTMSDILQDVAKMKESCEKVQRIIAELEYVPARRESVVEKGGMDVDADVDATMYDTVEKDESFDFEEPMQEEDVGFRIKGAATEDLSRINNAALKCQEQDELIPERNRERSETLDNGETLSPSQAH